MARALAIKCRRSRGVYYYGRSPSIPHTRSYTLARHYFPYLSSVPSSNVAVCLVSLLCMHNDNFFFFPPPPFHGMPLLCVSCSGWSVVIYIYYIHSSISNNNSTNSELIDGQHMT